MKLFVLVLYVFFIKPGSFVLLAQQAHLELLLLTINWIELFDLSTYRPERRDHFQNV